MALIDQARQIDVATASINRFVRSLSSSNFAAKMELARSGFRNVGAWAARHERLGIESKIARARDVVKKSDELFHADRVMALHPGKFQSSDQVKAYEMAMLKIRSPGLYKRRILEESVGVGGARDVLSGQAMAEYDRSLLEETDQVAALRKNLAERFGGATFGGYARADRLLNIRRQEIARKDRLTDYQREREELTERYLGDQGLADDEMNRRADRRHRLAESRASVRRKAERIDLAKRYPAFKRFFLDSRNSTKDIHAMAGYLKGMSKIPVVGGIFKANPIAAGSLAAIAAINALLNKQNAANLAATNWENAASFFGAPSKEFEGAARLAGIKDPAKIASIYGQYTKWGLDPAEMMREIGSQTIGRTPFEKQRIAEAYSKSLGVSLGADEIKLAEYLAGDTNISEAREVSAKLGLLETEEQFGFRSGSSLIEKLRSLSLWAPWSKDIEARTGISYVSAGYKYLTPMTAPMFAGYNVADWISAAIADDKYDSDAARNSSPSLPQSLTGSTSNWYGVTIVSDAKSIDELAKDAQRHADAKDEHLRAATSQDPGAQ